MIVLLMICALAANAQKDCYIWVGTRMQSILFLAASSSQIQYTPEEGMECEGLTNQKCKHGLSCVNHDLDPTTPRRCLARGQEGDICAGGVLQPFEGLPCAH